MSHSDSCNVVWEAVPFSCRCPTPHLNYGILLWGFKYDKVLKFQKRIITILSLSKYNAHTEPIFKKLKLLEINDILKLQELKFYYKYKKNNLPHNLQLAHKIIYINPLVNIFLQKTVFTLIYLWLLITLQILHSIK